MPINIGYEPVQAIGQAAYQSALAQFLQQQRAAQQQAAMEQQRMAQAAAAQQQEMNLAYAQLDQRQASDLLRHQQSLTDAQARVKAADLSRLGRENVASIEQGGRLEQQKRQLQADLAMWGGDTALAEKQLRQKEREAQVQAYLQAAGLDLDQRKFQGDMALGAASEERLARKNQQDMILAAAEMQQKAHDQQASLANQRLMRSLDERAKQSMTLQERRAEVYKQLGQLEGSRLPSMLKDDLGQIRQALREMDQMPLSDEDRLAFLAQIESALATVAEQVPPEQEQVRRDGGNLIIEKPDGSIEVKEDMAQRSRLQLTKDIMDTWEIPGGTALEQLTLAHDMIGVLTGEIEQGEVESLLQRARPRQDPKQQQATLSSLNKGSGQQQQQQGNSLAETAALAPMEQLERHLFSEGESIEVLKKHWLQDPEVAPKSYSEWKTETLPKAFEMAQAGAIPQPELHILTVLQDPNPTSEEIDQVGAAELRAQGYDEPTIAKALEQNEFVFHAPTGEVRWEPAEERWLKANFTPIMLQRLAIVSAGFMTQEENAPYTGPAPYGPY